MANRSVAIALCLVLAGCIGGGADPDRGEPPGPSTQPRPTPSGPPFIEALVENQTAITQVVPHGDALWFVERTGELYRWDGEVTLVHDLRGIVGSAASNQGVGGIWPDIYDEGRWYVSYTDKDGHGVLARGDGTWETVLVIPQPDTWHNINHVMFGPDGMLYIGAGDGGGYGDPYQNGQNRSNMLASILRIDVSQPGPYRIPPGNAFVEGEGAAEVYAWGLRNPWRFDFDADGDIWVADVGNGEMEEIDVITAPGQNFGWPKWEGTHPLQGGGDGFEMPVAAYARNETTGCAIIGGVVYEGDWFPELQDRFVFTDFCTGTVMYLNGTIIETLIDTELRINSVSQDADGELLLAADGVYRVGRLP